MCGLKTRYFNKPHSIDDHQHSYVSKFLPFQIVVNSGFACEYAREHGSVGFMETRYVQCNQHHSYHYVGCNHRQVTLITRQKSLLSMGSLPVQYM